VEPGGAAERAGSADAYPPAVTAERLRAIMIALFIAAGAVSVVARKTNEGWVTAISFTLFALGVGVYFRWRQRLRARVLDWKEKTPE
jgi:uncharacterized membrane protein YccC